MDQEELYRLVRNFTQGITNQPIVEAMEFEDPMLSLWLGSKFPVRDLCGEILDEEFDWGSTWYLEIAGRWRLYQHEKLYLDPIKEAGTYFESDSCQHIEDALLDLFITGFELEPHGQETRIQLSNDNGVVFELRVQPSANRLHTWYLSHHDSGQAVELDEHGQYQHQIQVGLIAQDSRTNQVSVAERELSVRETKAVMSLLKHAGDVVDLATLATVVFDRPLDEVKPKVYNIIRHLKLTLLDKFIANVFSQGYRLDHYVPPGVRIVNNQLVAAPVGGPVSEDDGNTVPDVRLLGQSAVVGDREVSLSKREYVLLDCLMNYEGRDVGSQTLWERGWPEAGRLVKMDSVRSVIRALRHKIELIPSMPMYILTGRDGYRFVYPHQSESAKLVSGDIQLDSYRQRAIVRGNVIQLSHHETFFLAALMERAGEIVKYIDLWQKLHPDSQQVIDMDAIKALIKQLRGKLEVDPAHPKLIITHTRQEYVFVASSADDEKEVIVVGEIKLDTTRKVARVGEREVDLSDLEGRVLAVLMTRADEKVSCEELWNQVWQRPIEEYNRSLVQNLVSYLRRKIEPDPRLPRYIHTFPPHNYMFRKALPEAKVITVRDVSLTLSPQNNSITIGSKHVALSSRQAAFLEYLMQRTGETVDRKMVWQKVWGERGQGIDRQIISDMVKRVRAKIEPDPAKPQYLISVRGEGYIFGD